MRIICDSSELSKACMNVQRTVSGKSTIPALEGILIEAADGKVNLTGYDLEVGSVVSLDCEVYEAGRVVLNAKNLCDILRMVPEDVVSIECDERNISKIKSGETEYSIIGSSADDYPDLPTINKYSDIRIKQSVLKDMIKKTIFSVSTGERNPVHTGVKFEISDNKIVLVAVDGARLAIRRENINYTFDDSKLEFVVPAGISVLDITKGSAIEDYTFSYSKINEDTYRVIAYSEESKTFNKNIDEIVQITINTPSIMETKKRRIDVINTYLVDNKNNELLIDDYAIKFGQVTSIKSIAGEMLVNGGDCISITVLEPRNVAIYSTDGRNIKNVNCKNGTRQVELPAGVYIVEGNKITVK